MTQQLHETELEQLRRQVADLEAQIAELRRELDEADDGTQ